MALEDDCRLLLEYDRTIIRILKSEPVNDTHYRTLVKVLTYFDNPITICQDGKKYKLQGIISLGPLPNVRDWSCE